MRVSVKGGLILTTFLTFIGTPWAEKWTVPLQDVSVIVGTVDGQVVKRLLFHADLSSLPVSVQIHHAELQVPQGSVPTVSGFLTLEFLPLRTDWTPGAVTWVTPWTTPGGDVDLTKSETYHLQGSIGDNLRLGLLSLVREWKNGATANSGVLVKVLDATGSEVSIGSTAP